MIRMKYLTAFQLYERSELVGNQDLKADIALSHTWNVARDIEKSPTNHIRESLKHQPCSQLSILVVTCTISKSLISTPPSSRLVK